jgi:hypothetical protein
LPVIWIEHFPNQNAFTDILHLLSTEIVMLTNDDELLDDHSIDVAQTKHKISWYSTADNCTDDKSLPLG